MAVFAGIDAHWDDAKVCLLNARGKRVGKRVFKADAEGLAALTAWLREQCQGQVDGLGVGVERPDGPVTETLVASGLAVYAINPKQAQRFRAFCSAAEAKDDERDAWALAAALRTDLEQFQRVEPDPPRVVLLRELTRLHATLRTEENRWANRLRELLHAYFPALLQLASENLLDPFLWELLERWPTPVKAARASAKSVAAILGKYRLRRVKPAQVLAALRAAGHELLPGTADALALPTLVAARMLRAVCEQREAAERPIETVLDELQRELATPEDPGDVALALSLRGLGPLGCARLFGEGWRYVMARDLEGLRTRGGCAPVTRASGRSKTVHLRRACNQHLQRGLHDWARGASLHDPAATAHYAELRGRGFSAERASRGLVDRLLPVLLAMLRDRTPYDPERRQRAGLREAA
ncbi:MAG: transposase [Armatimonadetes bacterium]|nr:transposase [Armatimonadota bacterium]